jgi:hypothetical protein
MRDEKHREMSKSDVPPRHHCGGIFFMFIAYVFTTVLATAANTYASIVDFRRPQWVLDNMTKWGGSHSWLFTLGGAVKTSRNENVETRTRQTSP